MLYLLIRVPLYSPFIVLVAVVEEKKEVPHA